MRIVLCEAADTEQAVQSAGQLVAVDKAELSHAKRQVAIGVRLGLVNEHAARAVHGLNGIILAVYLRGVHILFVMEPVTGGLPQLAV